MKKIHIPKVTGFPHWYWLEERRGRSDVSSSQLITLDEGILTPWISRKRENFVAWAKDELFTITVSMGDMFSEATILVEKIKTGQGNHPTGREASAAMVANERLKELLVEAQSQHFQLMHRLDGAKALLNSHICAYWSGICKESSNIPKELMKMDDDYLSDYLKYYTKLITLAEPHKEVLNDDTH